MYYVVYVNDNALPVELHGPFSLENAKCKAEEMANGLFTEYTVDEDKERYEDKNTLATVSVVTGD